MGRPRKVWPEAQVKELIRLREAGRTWKEIGARLGLPRVTCSRYWQEVLGLPAFRVTRQHQQQEDWS
ncbi:helix-turn-helix domain-containing protein [Gluconacetobacter diazotrophicus]|uniref:Myb-like domain-containing protein n=1 Tax=Gluconacetobacter diazotrophicus (strain ATCC 49037 / DSM 5601 / CCUG 37298 / CIP 103539 / LMG 7603 / PAl5) TaxID=272568 RepID=A9H6R7_GLUDA|nr:hypothetical protein [Gluconacetobacter diazotrophicus]CAP57537.1 hypothetical protein GDI3594 [Gluconacetobacter diazotrophicus PA1 5]